MMPPELWPISVTFPVGDWRASSLSLAHRHQPHRLASGLIRKPPEDHDRLAGHGWGLGLLCRWGDGGTEDLSAAGRLDGRDVDPRHLHHRLERTLGRGAIGVGDGGSEGARCDLP